MLICMRTTLVLEDHLLRKAKSVALEQGVTLSEVVNRALQIALDDSPPAVEPFRMITYGSLAEEADHEPEDFSAEMMEEDRVGLGR